MTIRIIAHGDSDGVCSAAIALAAFKEGEVFFSHPAGLLEDLHEVCRSGDIIIVLDIALSQPHLEEILETFEKIARTGKLIYIDHHPEPIGFNIRDLNGEIVHDTSCSTSELSYFFFKNRLNHDMSRVALYGAIGDYLDLTPRMKMLMNYWDKRTIYFEAGVLCQGLEGSRKMYDFKRHIVKHLSENKLPSSGCPCPLAWFL